MLTQGGKIVRLRLVTRQDAFQKRNRGLAVWVGAVDAIVFLEGFLRKAVESERGDGAFETRGGDTAEPGARNKDSFICVVAYRQRGQQQGSLRLRLITSTHILTPHRSQGTKLKSSWECPRHRQTIF